MLTLLIRAAPLSEKCKRSCTLENGVQAKLSPIRLHLVSDIAAAPSPVEVIAPPPILKMACAVSMTSVPASIVNTDRHFITLYDRARAATVCGGDCRTVTTPAAICNLEGTTAPRCPSSSATTPTILLGPMSGSESPPQAYGDPGPDPADTLRWCEARRTGSEPAGLQSWLSTGSLESEREDDDVFTVTDSEVWYVCEDAEESFSEEEGWLDGWEEFIIPSKEITLTSILSHNCHETTFSGYWHGSVHVISRKATSSHDLHHFWQEVTTLNKIRHESIQLFMGMTLDMGGGHLGLVMSPLKGEPLHTRLHEHSHQFSMTSKFKIVKQICEGMEYLHSRGIFHGCLSTSTVHVLNRVCIQFRPQVQLPRLAPCDQLVSLPPEDVRALALYRGSLYLPSRPSMKQDVFAFGTLLYELVLLEKPFKGVSRECVVWRVGSGHLQPLSLLPRGRLRGIIQRCWQLSPDSRPTFKSILSEVEQNVPVFSTGTGSGLQRSLSLPSVLTDPPSPTLIN